jgi:hypothetical protein
LGTYISIWPYIVMNTNDIPFIEIFKASFQLSFPNLCKDSARVLNVIKYVLGDIFAANLHALLLEYYKSVVSAR